MTALFDRIKRVLMDRGQYEPHLDELIAAYTAAYLQWKAAKEAVDTHGIVVDSPTGLRKNPAVGVQKDAADLMIRLAVKLKLFDKTAGTSGVSLAALLAESGTEDDSVLDEDEE